MFTQKRFTSVALFVAAIALVSGCELIASVDRSKIGDCGNPNGCDALEVTIEGPENGATVTDSTVTYAFSTRVNGVPETNVNALCTMTAQGVTVPTAKDDCSGGKFSATVSNGTYITTFDVTASVHMENKTTSATFTRWVTVAAVPQPPTFTTTPPAGITADNMASFTFDCAGTGCTMECKLDGAEWAACTNPVGFTNLGDGEHTFAVRTVDGEFVSEEISATWVVDTTPPTVLAGTTFSAPVATDSVTIAFSGSDANAAAGLSYACALDGGLWLPCAGGDTFGPVGEGSHTLEIRATDVVDNVTATPATVTWSYWAPPETTLDASGPAQGSTVSQTTATFTFSSPTATSFECKLNTGAWATCTSPYTTPTLGNGLHTVQIRAVRNGVPDATVETRSWTVDTGSAGQPPAAGGTIAAGTSHGCAVSSGSLFCWGYNGSMQLGELTGPPASNGHFLPTQMGSATNWASVSAGPNHTCAVTTTGALYCWGGNSYGQLGNPFASTFSGSNTAVTVAAGQTWKKVAAIDQHTCAIRNDQSLWCWGSNVSGELGQGTESYDPVTTPVQVGTATNWIDVGGGYASTCALNANGDLYCWGMNSFGRHGVGTTDNFGAPLTAAATDVKQFSAGGEFVCAVYNDGTLWCWGDNNMSQGTGDAGTTSYRTSPAKVGTATDWASVEAGITHTCAIKTNGTRWCWGDITNNALGDDGALSATQTTPYQVGSETDWLELSCNQMYCIGVRDTAGKDVFSWGDNMFNKAGLNADTTPVVSPMATLTPF